MDRITFIALVLGISVSSIMAQESSQTDQLQKIWTLSEGLDVPESACFNEATNTIYVSNVVGVHNVKDSTGYLSKLDVNGKMIEKNWVTGLNAPKGIACGGKKKLYVTDIDRVLEIDLKSGRILKTYRNAKSKSLNDVSVAADGRVYVSDSDGNCIFSIVGDSLQVLLESSALGGMNGILARDGLLYLGSKGNFISVDPTSKEIRILAEKVGYLDGIEKVAEGVFVTSDWKGTVKLISIGKGAEILLDTSLQKVNAADLGYIPAKGILLVPTFNNHQVVAYQLKH